MATAATDMDILTDGTDKFVGAIMLAVDNGAKKAFIPAASNDVITMTGSTAGGLVGSVVTITAREFVGREFGQRSLR